MTDYLLDLTAQLEDVDTRFKRRIRDLLDQSTMSNLSQMLLPNAHVLLENLVAQVGITRWEQEIPGWAEYRWRGTLRPGSRLGQLLGHFDLNPFERDVLLLCLLPMLDAGYSTLIACLRGENRSAITAEFALSLLCSNVIEQAHGQLYLHPGATLFSHGLFNTDPVLGGTLQTPLTLDPAVFHFLLGHQALPFALELCASWVVPSSQSIEHPFAEHLNRCCQTATRQGAMCVVLRTSTEASVAGLVAQVLARNERQTLLLNLSLLPDDLTQACSLVTQALREVRLRGAGLMLSGAGPLRDNRPHLLAFLESRLARHTGPVLVVIARHLPVMRLGNLPHVVLEVPNDVVHIDARLFYLQVGALGVEESVDIATLAQRYPLQHAHLAITLQEASLYATQRCDSTLPDEGDLRRALQVRMHQDFGSLVHRIEPVRTFDDLIVSSEVQVQLQEILSAIRQRDGVLNRGFGHKLGRATGISALFYGESGTGKTMTAEVLAGELGVDLMQIDLSAVVNKYIGETEKHLAKIFDLAERDCGVLFFDEADALFGKRTATQDSHDRHANIEVSYLLQRLEQHPGLVILSTNNRANLDTAFNRRITFMTRFSMPDVSMRERMWQAIWPHGLALSDAIDFADLARRVEISGSNIRNVALLATWLAAEDESRCVELRHLEQALKREMGKLGKIYS